MGRRHPTYLILGDGGALCALRDAQLGRAINFPAGHLSVDDCRFLQLSRPHASRCDMAHERVPHISNASDPTVKKTSPRCHEKKIAVRVVE
jgi:hypothetical protein